MRRVLRALLLLPLAWQAGAIAAEWDALPFGSLGGHYEANQGLNPVKSEEEEVAGVAASAGIAFKTATPVSTFTLKPQGRFTYFPDQQDRDYNNGFLDLDYRRRGQKSQFGLYGQFAHEIVTSEALPSTEPLGDLGNPLDDDAATVATRSRRTLYGIHPSLKYSMTPRQSLELSAGFSDVSYSRKLPGEELGYKFASAQVGWGMNRSPVDTLLLSLHAEHFDPESASASVPGVTSDIYGARLRWSHASTEKRRWYLQGGVNVTSFGEVAGLPARSDKFGYSAGVGASWERLTSTVFFDATYGVRPSSSGAVSNQGDVRLQVRRNFSERVSGAIGARYIRSDTVDPGAAAGYRDYLTADIELEWRWTARLSLLGELAYVRQKLENRPGAGDNQSALLAIVYDSTRTR